MRRLVRTAEKFLDRDVNLLILGESGTGKDYLSRAIHECGRRRKGPFVQVDCAGLPEELFESELFGHRKGAFTDASTSRPGRIELADGGTIVLEEIGVLPPSLQAKLLRVVQDKKVSRLGDARTRTVDVRVIATTNMPLETMVERGDFRSDLYYRLNVVSLQLPVLRERPEDIALLANEFLSDAASRHQRTISGIDPDALDLLRKHPWPGNIRELRNVVERAVIIETATSLSVGSLPTEGFVLMDAFLDAEANESHTLEDVERQYICEVLRRTGWNYSRAASILGINRKTLLEKRRKYGIESAGKQPSED